MLKKIEDVSNDTNNRVLEMEQFVPEDETLRSVKRNLKHYNEQLEKFKSSIMSRVDGFPSSQEEVEESRKKQKKFSR